MRTISPRAELSRFLRDVWWVAALWIVMAVLLGLSSRDGLKLSAGILGLGVALTPLIWLRWSGKRPGGREDLRPAATLFVIAALWFFVVGGLVLALLSALD